MTKQHKLLITLQTEDGDVSREQLISIIKTNLGKLWQFDLIDVEDTRSLISRLAGRLNKGLIHEADRQWLKREIELFFRG